MLKTHDVSSCNSGKISVMSWLRLGFIRIAWLGVLLFFRGCGWRTRALWEHQVGRQESSSSQLELADDLSRESTSYPTRPSHILIESGLVHIFLWSALMHGEIFFKTMRDNCLHDCRSECGTGLSTAGVPLRSKR
jgi:hypothetical protein